jgi:hypothetical protein
MQSLFFGDAAGEKGLFLTAASPKNNVGRTGDPRRSKCKVQSVESKAGSGRWVGFCPVIASGVFGCGFSSFDLALPRSAGFFSPLIRGSP